MDFSFKNGFGKSLIFSSSFLLAISPMVGLQEAPRCEIEVNYNQFGANPPPEMNPVVIFHFLYFVHFLILC